MSEAPEKWVICVVTLVSEKPREYGNYYLGVNGREAAAKMQDQIAKKGFKADGKRFFPDQIETLTLKRGEPTDEIS